MLSFLAFISPSRTSTTYCRRRKQVRSCTRTSRTASALYDTPRAGFRTSWTKYRSSDGTFTFSGWVLYQDIADQNRFRTSLTVSAARLSRALERAASHEPQAAVHREGQRDGSEHLGALQGVRHLPADRPQVASALPCARLHGARRAEPSPAFEPAPHRRGDRRPHPRAARPAPDLGTGQDRPGASAHPGRGRAEQEHGRAGSPSAREAKATPSARTSLERRRATACGGARAERPVDD